ncbi:hypothetical protein DAD99_21295 [Pseudarthrobacter sp. AB1]|nr:hypothetical protein [Pseudarthrobacter sp. AB1]
MTPRPVRCILKGIGGSARRGCGDRDLPSLQVLERILEEEGPETVAAIFAEPVQNSRGALVPPPGYWARLRKVCGHHCPVSI